MIANEQGNGAHEKWRVTTVGDLLSDDQVKHVIKIMRRTKDDTEAVERTYRYLRKFTANLESKGVVPRYLAYYFLYLRSQGLL